MVSSTEIYVQAARKQEDNSWKFEDIRDIDSSLFINTVHQTIILDSIYENVKFDL